MKVAEAVHTIPITTPTYSLFCYKPCAKQSHGQKLYRFTKVKFVHQPTYEDEQIGVEAARIKSTFCGEQVGKPVSGNLAKAQ